MQNVHLDFYVGSEGVVDSIHKAHFIGRNEMTKNELRHGRVSICHRLLDSFVIFCLLKNVRSVLM